MTTLSKLQKYLVEIEKNDTLKGTSKKGNKINAVLQLNSNALQEAKLIDVKIEKGKAGRLAGQIIGIKANINVLGLNASCGSKVLENYKSPYDATVIKKIKQEDGLILGMLNQDEFACGSSGETSAFGPTKSPVIPEMNIVAGGTSSGSAASVSANFCDLSLGSDTGGSIRMPANNCGVVGLKPTYGSVSRYGLIDLSMSLDQIGPFAKTVSECALLFDVIKGKDENDSISQDSEKLDLKKIDIIPKNIIVGLLDFPVKDKRISELIENKINESAKKYNWKIVKIKIPYLDLAVETYYPLVYVEFFSGTRKFDGRRYGKKIEEYCGPEVLRRILGGSEISKAEHAGRYYHQALKSKKLISDELEKLFKKVDVIISPVIPRLPHIIGSKISVEEMYAYDALTIPYNLYGNCALSLPIGKIDGIPVGMQISCDKFQEQKLFQIARSVEKLNR